MSKKAAKPSKKPIPTNASERSSERRSPSKTTPPPQLEHKSGPIMEETAQLSNIQTQHLADNERSTPDQVGPEGGPGGQQNVGFVRNAPSFVRSKNKPPPEFDDGTPESRSAFEAKAQRLMEKLREQNMSIAEIAKLFDMSKSGTWARVGFVQPKLATPPVQETLPPSSLSQPTNTDGRDGSYQVPKISSEIIGDRPRVIEDNGHYPEQTRPSVIVENNGGAPVRVVVDPNSPYLQELLVQLLHLSTTRNVSFKKYLETGMAVEDLRNASFAATLVPGETSEEFRRNLLSIAKKANLHDRYKTDAGLDDTEVQPR